METIKMEGVIKMNSREHTDSVINFALKATGINLKPYNDGHASLLDFVIHNSVTGEIKTVSADSEREALEKAGGWPADVCFIKTIGLD